MALNIISKLIMLLKINSIKPDKNLSFVIKLSLTQISLR